MDATVSLRPTIFEITAQSLRSTLSVSSSSPMKPVVTICSFVHNDNLGQWIKLLILEALKTQQKNNAEICILALQEAAL